VVITGLARDTIWQDVQNLLVKYVVAVTYVRLYHKCSSSLESALRSNGCLTIV
jgi:hypothetical protein